MKTISQITSIAGVLILFYPVLNMSTISSDSCGDTSKSIQCYSLYLPLMSLNLANDYLVLITEVMGSI